MAQVQCLQTLCVRLEGTGKVRKGAMGGGKARKVCQERSCKKESGHTSSPLAWPGKHIPPTLNVSSKPTLPRLHQSLGGPQTTGWLSALTQPVSQWFQVPEDNLLVEGDLGSRTQGTPPLRVFASARITLHVM